MKSKQVLLGMALLLAWGGQLRAQSKVAFPQEVTTAIDRIFEDAGWNEVNAPGIAFAIVKEGTVPYQKYLGSADITNAIPITKETRFNLGQLSAHFTAYSILQLVVGKKLKLDEDVRSHIPQLQHFSQKVTVQHLLSSSSGLYDYHTLLTVMGRSIAEPLSQTTILQLVARQKALSFIPGTDFAESDTNFVILAELITKISGQPYAQYLQEQLFKPLGMLQTFVRDRADAIHPKVAHAYRTEQNNLFDNTTNNSILGSNNVFSSIKDLILWEKHLKKLENNSPELAKLVRRPVTLDNGKKYSTSAGELSLGQWYGHLERGAYSTYLLGSSGGHDSAIFKFPEQDYVAIALSNDGRGYNGFTGVMAAHLAIATAFTEPETTDYTTLKTIKKSPEQLAAFEGNYWDALGELSREIKVTNDTLRYVRTNGNSNALIPLSTNRFQMKVPYDDKIYLTFSEGNPKTMTYEYLGADPIPFEQYTPIVIEERAILDRYKGTYINRDYSLVFTVKVRQGELVVRNSRMQPYTYTPLKENTFFGTSWFMGHLAFKEDRSGAITGFVVTNNRLRNLTFEKLADRLSN
ncbi:MAG: serine hydrolase domain-containing protein [Bacteroidota bacterium]